MNRTENRKNEGKRSTASKAPDRKSSSIVSVRTNSSYRNGDFRGNRKGRKKRRKPFGGLLVFVVPVLAVVLLVLGAVKLTGAGRSGKTEAGVTLPEETQLKKEVMVEGINITGMSRTEAKAALEQACPWGMKAVYRDKERELTNFLSSRVEALLEEIYTGEPEESYELSMDGLEAEVEAEVNTIAADWDIPAKNGSISGFDKEAGKFLYSEEQKGVVIDREQLSADILEKLKNKEFQAEITASANEVIPQITQAQARELYQVIGTYSTKTTANSDRNKNIELASGAMNGLIIQPGEEFSFNATTGNRTAEKGYRPAGAYSNGVLIEEPGGGVCQVSSTLYNAVVFSGLTTTERHAHSYEPSYVTPGEDAMVSYDGHGGPDMKFVNNASTAIAIRTSFADRNLKVSIVGIPILEEGVTLSMSSKKTAELDSPAPVYEEDQTLQPEEEKVAIQETKGSRWVTNLVKKKDGVVVSDEFFHNSTYRGKPATIKRNTSGVVIPAETSAPSEPPQSSGETPQTKPSASESTTAATAAAPQGPVSTIEETKTEPPGPSGDGPGSGVVVAPPF